MQIERLDFAMSTIHDIVSRRNRALERDQPTMDYVMQLMFALKLAKMKHKN